MNAKHLASLFLFISGPAFAGICDSEKLQSKCFPIQGQIEVFANSRPYLTRSSDGHQYWIETVPDEEVAKYRMPADLQERIFALETVKGTFDVCPLEPFHKGKMQKICLQSFKD